MRAVAEAIRQHFKDATATEATDLADTLDSDADELDAVDFPGMFG